jgi:hypothetical protein
LCRLVDLIINGYTHRLDSDDLYVLYGIAETGFNTLQATPRRIRENKTVKELGALTIDAIRLSTK